MLTKLALDGKAYVDAVTAAPPNARCFDALVVVDDPMPSRIAVPWLALAVLGCCPCTAVPLMHPVPLVQGCGMPTIHRQRCAC